MNHVKTFNQFLNESEKRTVNDILNDIADGSFNEDEIESLNIPEEVKDMIFDISNLYSDYHQKGKSASILKEIEKLWDEILSKTPEKLKDKE